MEIAKDHFAERKLKYKERHAFLLTKMEARKKFITNRARFILENIEKKISVMNRKKKDIVKTLIEREYDSDPVKAWKTKMARERGIEIDEDKDPDDQEDEANPKVKKKTDFLPGLMKGSQSWSDRKDVDWCIFCLETIIKRQSAA